jgi:hypothetical protein
MPGQSPRLPARKTRRKGAIHLLGGNLAKKIGPVPILFGTICASGSGTVDGVATLFPHFSGRISAIFGGLTFSRLKLRGSLWDATPRQELVVLRA